MPRFDFEVRTPIGRRQSGTQEAASPQALISDLRQRGWLVLRVEPAAEPLTVGTFLANLNPLNWLPPRSLDIEMSLLQIAVMLRSGLTLLTALKSAGEYAQRRSMRLVWDQVAERIQQGSSVADALALSRCFPHLVVQLVRVGEQTGTLEVVVARAAETLERRRLLRGHMLTAMAYPMIVLLAAIGTTAFMIINVIPKLQVFLRSLGRRLPAMTQTLLDVSDAIYRNLMNLGILFVVLTVAMVVLYLWPPSRLVIDRWVLRVPIIGRLLRLGLTVQFTHGLGIMLRSGITLVEGLRTVEELLRNRHARQRVGQARMAVVQGSSLALALERASLGVFMPMVSRMAAVGEAAGTLDDVFEESARFHEHQLQIAIRRLSIIIEPAVVVVVGGIVGFVYIAFFVALFSVAGGAR